MYKQRISVTQEMRPNNGSQSTRLSKVQRPHKEARGYCNGVGDALVKMVAALQKRASQRRYPLACGQQGQLYDQISANKHLFEHRIQQYEDDTQYSQAAERYGTDWCCLWCLSGGVVPEKYRKSG